MFYSSEESVVYQIKWDERWLYLILNTSLIRLSLKGWENVLFELGSERVSGKHPFRSLKFYQLYLTLGIWRMRIYSQEVTHLGIEPLTAFPVLQTSSFFACVGSSVFPRSQNFTKRRQWALLFLWGTSGSMAKPACCEIQRSFHRLHQYSVGHLVFLWNLVPRAFLARRSVPHVRRKSRDRHEVCVQFRNLSKSIRHHTKILSSHPTA